MRIHGQPLVDMITRIRVIGTPAIGPDARWPRQSLPGAKDDPDGFVVEDERKTGHAVFQGKSKATMRFVVSLYIAGSCNTWDWFSIDNLTRVVCVPLTRCPGDLGD